MPNPIEPTPRPAPPRAIVQKPSRQFEKIKGNPKGDWSIEDIQAACRQLDMMCVAPTRGSHHKVTSPHIAGHLTVPYKRPIKTIYIKSFIRLGEAHIKARQSMENPNG